MHNILPGMQNPKFKGFVISLCMVAPVLHAAEYSVDQLNALVQQAQYKQALSTEANPSAVLTNDPNASNDNPADSTSASAKNPDTSADHGNTTNFETPKTPPKAPTLRDRAFKDLMDKISPLTPEQILHMRQQEDKTQQAIATTPNTPPIPVSSTLTVDLSPGITPPVVRLASGFVTSLVFVDSSGQPWPIADYSLGNPGDFNIQWDKKAHTLFIQSTTTYSSANLAIRLMQLDTPVMISLVSGQKYVDYRVDLQVQGRGPNALASITGHALPHASPLLLNALDGIPPPGSEELEVSGGLGRAWLTGGKLIFRTQLTVLSPAWSTIASSADGTRVYEMIQTPLILASHNGKTIEIVIKGL